MLNFSLTRPLELEMTKPKQNWRGNQHRQRLYPTRLLILHSGWYFWPSNVEKRLRHFLAKIWDSRKRWQKAKELFVTGFFCSYRLKGAISLFGKTEKLLKSKASCLQQRSRNILMREMTFRDFYEKALESKEERVNKWIPLACSKKMNRNFEQFSTWILLQSSQL